MIIRKITGGFFNQDNLPSFLSVEALTDKLTDKGIPITETKVVELASSGRLPCFYFADDSSQPFFLWKDVSEWIMENLLHRSCGAEMDVKVVEVVAGSPAGSSLPVALSVIEQLLVFPLLTEPAVYFLCRDGKVVYVGQSTNLPQRIAAHQQSEKVFDKVYFLLVPASDLDAVERKFIKSINPFYNRTFVTKNEPQQQIQA